MVTGGASGIGLASVQALIGAGATVVAVDRDDAALSQLANQHGKSFIPMCANLLNADSRRILVPRILDLVGTIDIFHANAGMYIGGDLLDADADDIDRMLNLNINVVIKNVHAVLPHMIERGGGDVIVTSSLAAHFPTPWEPIYAASKWAIDCFVQTTRRQMFRHGIRIGAVSPGPVNTALLSDWPEDKLNSAISSGSLMEASQVGEVIVFMLTRPRGVTIRDVVMLPSNFDL